MAIVIANGVGVAVNANTKTSDQVTGTYQFTGPGTYTLIAKASAGAVNANLIVGGSNLCNDQPIPFLGTSGTLSVTDNIMVSQRIFGLSNRAELTFRETAGTNRTVDFQLLWDPLLGGVFGRRG